MMIDTSELPRKSMQTGSFKPSYYNNFYEVDDGYIMAYNAFSNVLVAVLVLVLPKLIIKETSAPLIHNFENNSKGNKKPVFFYRYC
jgi:hypothetical protein